MQVEQVAAHLNIWSIVYPVSARGINRIESLQQLVYQALPNVSN